MKSKKIHIGMVCSPWLGGSGVVGSQLAKYLAHTGKYKVSFIGFDFPFKLSHKDIEFYKVKYLKHPLFIHPLSEESLIGGIVDAVIKGKIDIIHAHFAFPFAYCALQAREILKARNIDLKVVTTLHGTDVLTVGQEIPAIMKYLLDQSDALTAVSNDLAKRIKRMYRTRRRIEVIYNFIDLEHVASSKKDSTLRKRFAKQDEKVFVHISNFRPIKRIRDTLKVFYKLEKKIPSKLLLIGEGPEIQTAKRIYKSLHDDKLIHFIGKVKNPDPYIQIADGIIITSEYESFSLVALEAMAFGVPVFGVRAGGLPEVIENKKSGFLVKVGDTDALSKQVIKYFSRNDIRQINTIKDYSIERSQKYEDKKIVPMYEKIYTKLLSK